MSAAGRRNLIIALIAAGVLVVGGAVALVLALSQSTPTPTPTTTTATVAPSESSTPTSTPTPTVTAQARGELVLGAEGFELTTDGETLAFRWGDDPAEAVAALTSAIGTDPEERVDEGDGNHFPDYAVWAWPGLEFGSMVETDDGIGRDEYAAPAWVRFTANEVEAVEVSAEFGLAVGMSVEDVRAAGPDLEYPSPNADGPRFIFAEERSAGQAGDSSQQVSVIVDADEDSGVVMIAYQLAALF